MHHASALLGALAKRMPKTAHLIKDHKMIRITSCGVTTLAAHVKPNCMQPLSSGGSCEAEQVRVPNAFPDDLVLTGFTARNSFVMCPRSR